MNTVTCVPSRLSRLRLRRAQRPILLLAASFVALGACDDDDITVPPTASTVEVTPRVSSVPTGQSVQLNAQPRDASGNDMSGGTVTWKSLDTLVARVSETGLVTVLSSGTTAITASVLGATGFASIDAVGVTSTVVIEGTTTGNLPQGQTLQLTAAAREAGGRELWRPVTWSSSAPTVATVSNTGLVTSLSVGTTTITATAEGRSATRTINVLPPAPVETVSITPATGGYLPTTVGVPFTATMRDVDGGVLSGRTATWSSSNTAVATVTGAGVVTALTPGTVTITATSEGKSGTATYTAVSGLRSGTGQTFGNSTGAAAYYAVYVPAGSTQLQVTLRNGTGDPDLYVYRPGQALTSTPACASETGGATVSETCTLANPIAGVWVMRVDAFETHANTTITATLTPTPP